MVARNSLFALLADSKNSELGCYISRMVACLHGNKFCVLDLQFIDLLPLCDVSHYARELQLISDSHFADCKFHRKCGSIFSSSLGFSSDANHLFHPSLDKILQVLVVFVFVGRWHQDLHILSNDFSCLVLKQSLCCRIEALNHP